MAGSRLEKIGTIYARATGLLKSGAVSWDDRPLWYDIYEAFPPKEEPKFDRPTPRLPLRKIFYEEDKTRALFHRHNKRIGTINMLDDRYRTLTQRFVDNYRKLQQQYGDDGNEEQLYREAIDLLQRDRDVNKQEDDEISLSSAFKAAQNDSSKNEPNLNVRITDIMKS